MHFFRTQRLWTALAFPTIAGISACAFTMSRPCSKGGDVTWRSAGADSQIRGDKHCKQTPLPDGSYVNHGEYTITFPSGKLALSGRFENGRKEGVWSEYNEQGEKIAERYFEGGIERSVPPGVLPSALTPSNGPSPSSRR